MFERRSVISTIRIIRTTATTVVVQLAILRKATYCMDNGTHLKKNCIYILPGTTVLYEIIWCKQMKNDKEATVCMYCTDVHAVIIYIRTTGYLP